MKRFALAVLVVVFGVPNAFSGDERYSKVVTVCQRELATGFNWEGGKWVQANFAGGRKTTIRKIDTSYFEKNPDEISPSVCMNSSANQSGDSYAREGCYLIEDEGLKKSVIFAEKCTEIYKNGKLFGVQCDQIGFSPDGLFVRHPAHKDIDEQPQDGYKDSLVVSVGKCRAPRK